MPFAMRTSICKLAFGPSPSYTFFETGYTGKLLVYCTTYCIHFNTIRILSKKWTFGLKMHILLQFQPGAQSVQAAQCIEADMVQKTSIYQSLCCKFQKSRWTRKVRSRLENTFSDVKFRTIRGLLCYRVYRIVSRNN